MLKNALTGSPETHLGVTRGKRGEKGRTHLIGHIDSGKEAGPPIASGSQQMRLSPFRLFPLKANLLILFGWTERLKIRSTNPAWLLIRGGTGFSL
jgi:hypothetical protein